jgi:predicted metalloprotease with PDZ domain
MARVLLTAAAALALLGAAKPASVDYRLTVEPQATGPAVLDVEVRLRGDADGETRLVLPARLASDLAARGARVEAPDATHRILRHRAGAKLTLHYRVQGTASDSLAAQGEAVFAAPDGRESEAATFRWTKLPAGWRTASDLEHGAQGRPMTVGDIVQSVILAGPNLRVAERPIDGGVVRAAMLGTDPARAQRLADAAAPVVAAERAFWGDESGPFLVAAGPFTGPPSDRGDAVAFAEGPTSDADLRDTIAQGHIRAWIPRRTGRTPPAPEWLTNGLADLYADRILLRAGLLTPDAAVGRLASADLGRDASRRGQILALKWDDEVRRKTGGKADLDDVLIRMRDHYRQFPPGQGPDIVTGLVSAAWVTAGLDLRPDIARYGDGTAAIPLPETLFDGCLDARVTVAPGFDSGFDHTASFAAKRLVGVRARGPAWNSGLRNGMALQSWTLTPGDMSREIQLTVRDGRKRAKTVRYWPYGDADVEARKLQLAFGLSGDKLAACGRKIAGL